MTASLHIHSLIVHHNHQTTPSAAHSSIPTLPHLHWLRIWNPSRHLTRLSECSTPLGGCAGRQWLNDQTDATRPHPQSQSHLYHSCPLYGYPTRISSATTMHLILLVTPPAPLLCLRLQSTPAPQPKTSFLLHEHLSMMIDQWKTPPRYMTGQVRH